MIEIPADIGEYLKKNLSQKRYEHTLGVVASALRLAARWEVDKSRAYYASLLHDCAKNLSDSELILRARTNGIALDEIMLSDPQLLHAEIGAIIAREKFGITDEKILRAISRHTMGDEKMSGLDKVIFLADMIEEHRSFEGVSELRAAAFEELDLGVLMGLDSVITFTKKKGKRLHPRTVRARDYIKEHYCEEPYTDENDELFFYEETLEAEKQAEQLYFPDAEKYLVGNESKEEKIIKKVFQPSLGKTAVITGASGGIGSAIAERFAAEGYNSIVCYNENGEKAQKTAEMLVKKGFHAEALKLNVADVESVEEAVSYIIQNYGFIDCLVNCAGISSFRMFTDITEENWQEVLNVNLGGVYRLTKAVLPYMISEKRGSIVNISSMWGQIGASCEVAYSAAKGGVISLTKALAKEVGPSGIRVNCVCPGVIDTKMNAKLTEADISSLCEETPLMRIGSPAEVASAVYFLSCDEASFITGETLSVSGGFVI